MSGSSGLLLFSKCVLGDFTAEWVARSWALVGGGLFTCPAFSTLSVLPVTLRWRHSFCHVLVSCHLSIGANCPGTKVSEPMSQNSFSVGGIRLFVVVTRMWLIYSNLFSTWIHLMPSHGESQVYNITIEFMPTPPHKRYNFCHFKNSWYFSFLLW